MKAFGKTLALLSACLALAGCGGGGGDGGAFSAPQNGSITLTADRTTLPLNPGNVLPFPGSPYMATVSVTFRSANGTIEAPNGDATFTINNPNIVSISPPDDPSTENINEMQQRMVSFPQTLNNGSATVFVTAYDVAGSATLTVSAVDPQTNVTVTRTIDFIVASGVGQQPASVQMAASPTAVYLPDSGAGTTSLVSANVLDGAGQPVPNPGSGNSGFDNVHFEIVGDAGGAQLSATSAAGSVTSTAVDAHTVNGVATVSFSPGTVQGPVQVKATADRADNNVSNGIADPVSATTTLVVSDGKLASIQITSPIFATQLPGVTVNSLPVSDDVTPPADGQIPPNPDATLSLVVTAKASDRQGNPVRAGTQIRFGAIDTPVTGFSDANPNAFALSGLDGVPQVGGNAFAAATGQFRTAGGGAGPGDALLVLGKWADGFTDLENAVTVTAVNSQTSLTAAPKFNLNDLTGVSVPAPATGLPYVIGRSGLGSSITGSAVTDENGIAHASLTYVVQAEGHAVAIWAEGVAPTGSDTNHQVTDALLFTYPGVAPATISASPDPILGNNDPATQPQVVTVCVADALGVAVPGVQVAFSFAGPGGTGGLVGTGSVDGTSGTGTFARATDETGCTQGTVVTSGLPASSEESNSGTLVLSAAGATTSVGIIVNVATLQVSPNSVSVPSAGVTATITVTALDTSGQHVGGAVVTGTCTATGASAAIELTPSSQVTDGTGKATFVAAATGFVGSGSGSGGTGTAGTSTPPEVGSGSCVFSAPGTDNAIVRFSGTASCGDFSPPTCGD